MISKPGLFRIYKKKGALAMTLLPPKYDTDGYMSKAGAVLLDVAPGIGDQVWDWDSKFTFAITLADMAALLDSDPSKKRIFHKHNDSSKAIEFKQGHNGTYLLNCNETAPSVKKFYIVPLNNGEYSVMMRLLLQAAPLLIGWTDIAVESELQKKQKKRNSNFR